LRDEVVGQYKIEELDEFGETMMREYKQQDEHVGSMEVSLNDLELKRVELVETEVRRCVADLMAICFALPNDIEFAFQQEIKEVNIHVVRNRATYQELVSRLYIDTAKRQETAWENFQRRKVRWKALRHIYCIDTFKATVTNQEWQMPKQRRDIFEKLKTYMQAFEKEGGKLITELQNMVAPYIDPKTVETVCLQLQDLYMEKDKETDDCVLELQALEDAKEQEGKELIAELRKDLINIDAMDETKIDQQLAEDCQPLLTARHDYVNDLIDRTRFSLYGEMQRFLRNIDNMSKFYKVASTFWQNYIDTVDAENKNIVEQLDIRGDQYDDQVANAEAKLADEVKLLRCEPDEETLNQRFDNVRALVGPLGFIEKAHRTFAKESVDMAKNFPPHLHSTIESFIFQICTHFGLQTEEQFEKYVVKKEVQKLKEVQAKNDVDDEGGKKTGKKGKGKGKEAVPAAAVEQEIETPEVDIEAAKKAAPKLEISGRTFYIIAKLDELAKIMTQGSAEDQQKAAEADAAVWEERKAKENARLGKGLTDDDMKEPVSARKEAAKPAKKKGKKDLEEEKRLAEEEALNTARKLEEAKQLAAEEEKKRREIPTDLDGGDCSFNIKFDLDSLMESLPKIRHGFLKTSQDHGDKNDNEADVFSKSRQRELTTDLSLILRKYYPRFGRIEIDVYEPRQQQLRINMQRFKRHELRFITAVQEEDNEFDAAIHEAHKHITHFLAVLEQRKTEVDEGKSLAVLQKCRKEARNARFDLLENVATATKELNHTIHDLIHNTDNGQALFIEGCLPFKTDEEGILHGAYHQQEIAFYSGLTERLAENREIVMNSQRQLIQELNEKTEKVQDLTPWEDNYKIVLEDLSVREGLGHKYGAPKRKMTATVRAEFSNSTDYETAINDRLKLLTDLCNQNERITKAMGVEDPKFPPLPVPAEEESLTTTIVKELQALREQFFTRVNYLQLLKDEFKGMFNVEPVPVLPVLEEQITVEPEEEEDAAGKGGKAAPKAKGKEPAKPAKGKAKESVGKENEDNSGPPSFMDIIMKADVTCKEEMQDLYKAYDAAHPERRKQEDEPAPDPKSKGKKGADKKGGKADAKAPPAVEYELPYAIKHHCETEVRKATEKREVYIAAFRKQVASLDHILVQCTKAVFSDVVFRTQRTAKDTRSEIQVASDRVASELNQILASNLAQLKPTLGSKQDHLLEDLIKKEDSRFEKANQSVVQHREQLLQLEKAESIKFLQRMMFVSSTLLTLFDNMVYPNDILDADEDADAGDRKPLKELVRERNRIEKIKAGGGDTEVKRFHISEWPGLKLDEFALDDSLAGSPEKPEPVADELASADASAKKQKSRGGSAKGKKGKDTPTEETEAPKTPRGPTLSAFNNPPSRAVIISQRAAYNKYLELFKERTSEAIEKAKSTLKEEELRRDNWLTNIAYLKANQLTK